MVMSDVDKINTDDPPREEAKLKRKGKDSGDVENKKVKRSEDVSPEKKPNAKPSNKKDLLTNKTGGAYIPPARLRMMQAQLTDKNSEQYQRMSWEALKKSINGLVNKVNISNINEIVKELMSENIVRGRGLLGRSIIQAQNASPTFTRVYAALVAVINTRFPQNGELILRRLILEFRKSFKRNKKDQCLHSAQFIAHLVNQQVAHEIIALQILALMLETPNNDSVEVAIGFLKEVGLKLTEVSPRGIAAVFDRLRAVLNAGELDKRVQYMIEVMFAIRKDAFKEHPSVTEDLDLVEESDQFTHMLTVDDDSGKGAENELNVFHMDPDFQQNEENYNQIKREILDSSGGSSSSDGSGSSDSDTDDEGEGEEDEKTQEIEDKTETNLVALRRTVYLAIQSSLDFEECAHKLLKMEFAEKDYKEICAMIIDCCSQQRTYEKFFGLLGGRFCILKKEFMEHFETLFGEHYETIHRLETNKLRNTAKFFAHLLHSDSLPWTVLSNIQLSEETTSSSSRIFIKILFQELVEYLGLYKLNQRLKDETLAPFFEGLFPRSNPKDTRFAINFFTSIGLGGLTDELRDHLKSQAHVLLQMQNQQSVPDSSSSSDDEDSSSSSSDSEEERKKRKKKKKRKSKKSKDKKEKKEKKSKRKKKHKKKSSSESSSEEDEKQMKPTKEKKAPLSSRLLKLSNTVDEKTVIKQEKMSSDENEYFKHKRDVSEKEIKSENKSDRDTSAWPRREDEDNSRSRNRNNDGRRRGSQRRRNDSSDEDQRSRRHDKDKGGDRRREDDRHEKSRRDNSHSDHDKRGRRRSPDYDQQRHQREDGNRRENRREEKGKHQNDSSSEDRRRSSRRSPRRRSGEERETRDIKQERKRYDSSSEDGRKRTKNIEHSPSNKEDNNRRRRRDEKNDRRRRADSDDRSPVKERRSDDRRQEESRRRDRVDRRRNDSSSEEERKPPNKDRSRRRSSSSESSDSSDSDESLKQTIERNESDRRHGRERKRLQSADVSDQRSSSSNASSSEDDARRDRKQDYRKENYKPRRKENYNRDDRRQRERQRR